MMCKKHFTKINREIKKKYRKYTPGLIIRDLTLPAVPSKFFQLIFAHLEYIMNKWFIFSFLFVFVSILSAQKPVSEFHAGILMPQDADNGFIGGITMGRAIDKNLSWGFEVDYYTRSYSEETVVQGSESGTVQTDVITTLIENSTRMFPVFFKMAYTTDISPKLDLRFSGGLGYEFMWNSEVNHEKNIDETRHYSGFAWFAGGGISFPTSQASDLFIEANYHSGNPSRSEGTNPEGLPVRTEVDMSGLMIRAGLKVHNFGFF